MNIKTIINVMKVVSLAVTVVPPVIGGAKVIFGGAAKVVKNKIYDSEYIKDVKKDFELRRDNVQTVKYTEV
jgi:ribosomal protein S24E